MDKALLRRIGRFHLVKPEELESFEEHVEWLEAILHEPCEVWDEDGEQFLIEIRALVDRLNGLRIEIYPNEHPPPHFHVKGPTLNASFTIEACEHLAGEVDPRVYRKICFWHKASKDLLIEKWNETRPTECQVGAYQGV